LARSSDSEFCSSVQKGFPDVLEDVLPGDDFDSQGLESSDEGPDRTWLLRSTAGHFTSSAFGVDFPQLCGREEQEMTDRDFVQVTDILNAVQIINVRQIVRARQQADNWEIVLTVGDDIVLPESEAKNLLKRLSCVETQK
jgi:hypothetical protein